VSADPQARPDDDHDVTGSVSPALVGVVGAGTMGAGIAQVAAVAGHRVLLFDLREGAAVQAIERLRAGFDQSVSRGRLAPDDAAAILARLGAVEQLDALAGCSVVVEAVAEDLEVKRALFAALESRLTASALLATNTSSLSVTAVAGRLTHPERVVGLHFFNPAPRMRLVEVVRGDATSDAVVETAVDLARAWGKTPVVCASTPGFIVNRVARPYYGEAQRLVEEGVADPATIDAVLREAGGFPLGPFELTDLVGQDVNLAVSRSVWEQTFHDPRYAPTVFQQRLVDAGRLGRKSGRGVFTYGADGVPTDAQPRTEPAREAPDRLVLNEFDGAETFPVMRAFVDRVEAAGVVIERFVLDLEDLEDDDQPGLLLPGGATMLEVSGQPAATTWVADEGGVVLLDWAHDPATCTRVALIASDDVSEESLDAAVGLCQRAGVAVSIIGDSPGGVVARTVAMVVNEAVELVARREASAEDVDVAMVLGTGYPSGPIGWGERLGDRVAEVIESAHDAMPTGRYRVSRQLARVVRSGRRLREL
jgi:3-hydroxybutyryl-CoA dehydrogenase